MSYFDSAFKNLLPEEGGYDTNAGDRGNWSSGICGVGQCLGTNYGVDTASYADIRAALPGLPALVRDLTQADAARIYKSQYWDKCRCDELPPELALVVFDCAVNSGCGKSIKILQNAVGVPADGGFGPMTLAAVNGAVAATSAQVVAGVCLDDRLDFMKTISTWPTFGRGWQARIDGLRERIKTIAGTP